MIAAIDRAEDFTRLPEAEAYIVKPKFGADDVGMSFLDAKTARAVDEPDILHQPKIEFDYKVSFYFINRAFEYALCTPDPAQRWRLNEYEPRQANLEFGPVLYRTERHQSRHTAR